MKETLLLKVSDHIIQVVTNSKLCLLVKSAIPKLIAIVSKFDWHSKVNFKTEVRLLA